MFTLLLNMAATDLRSFPSHNFPLSIYLLRYCSFKGKTSLCKCAPIMSSLLATVMSNWEVCRDKTVTQSSELFHDTQYIMEAMVEVCHMVEVCLVLVPVCV